MARGSIDLVNFMQVARGIVARFAPVDPDGAGARRPQKDVLIDRQVRDQADFLRGDGDAMSLRILWIVEHNRGAINKQLPLTV